MNYYPFNIGDYTAHTAHLDEIEDLVYRRLLDQYYLREMPMPLEPVECARLIRMKKHEAIVITILNEFFQWTPDGWRNPRADQEIAGVQLKTEENINRVDGKQSRIQRFRLQRSAMFHALHAVGEYPVFNLKMGDLRQLFIEKCDRKTVDETLGNVTSNLNGETLLATGLVTTTNADATAIHKTQDTRHKTQIKKKRVTVSPLPFQLPDWIPVEAWDGYVEMRKSIGKSMTDRARSLRIADLEKLRDAGHDVAAILNKSTANNWTDVYPPKPANGAARAPAPEPAWRTEQRERMRQAAPYAFAKPRPQSDSSPIAEEISDVFPPVSIPAR